MGGRVVMQAWKAVLGGSHIALATHFSFALLPLMQMPHTLPTKPPHTSTLSPLALPLFPLYRRYTHAPCQISQHIPPSPPPHPPSADADASLHHLPSFLTHPPFSTLPPPHDSDAAPPLPAQPPHTSLQQLTVEGDAQVPGTRLLRLPGVFVGRGACGALGCSVRSCSGWDTLVVVPLTAVPLIAVQLAEGPLELNHCRLIELSHYLTTAPAPSAHSPDVPSTALTFRACPGAAFNLPATLTC